MGQEYRVRGEELRRPRQGDAQGGAKRACAFLEAVHCVRSRGLTGVNARLLPEPAPRGGAGSALGQACSSRPRDRRHGLRGRLRSVPGYDCQRCAGKEECKKKGLPWTLAKSFTASCPVSAFVPKEKVPDPHALRLWLKVNGELRQEGKTSSMIFSIPYIISYVSKIVTLEEGDLILTGTPKGVGPVKENDEIEAGIDGVVSMKFKVKKSEY